MKAGLLLAQSCLLITSILIAGCKGAQGDCTYDTDCPQICQVCDTNSHRCVDSPACEDVQRGICSSNYDCDEINEICEIEVGNKTGVCKARNEDVDGGSGSDGDRPVVTDRPQCEGIDPDVVCVEPGLSGQGIDRDGDLWGECCDCDDRDSTVNPGARELIYNCKDDDCKPESLDDDLDHDGYGSMYRICDPGPDCDDRDPTVHPGAAELCDGKDNNCDGPIDDGDVCQRPDGGQDGGADVPACPNVAGTYRVEANCMMIDDADVILTQVGCVVTLNFEGIPCSGTIDAGLNVYIECAGIPVACTGKFSLSSSFLIFCSDECSFRFTPISGASDCTYHTQPECTNNGQLCGVVGNAGVPETKCVNLVPGGREPGYYCNPTLSIDCRNSLCIDNYCGAICTSDTHCISFAGTTCQTVTYNDGQGTQGDIQSCAPENFGETRCRRSTECSPSRVCSYRVKDNDVVTVCRGPEGDGVPGDTCTDNADCETNLCVCENQICSGGEQGTCSAICTTGADCVQGYTCGTVPIPDLNSVPHQVPACIQDIDSCGRDEDCPAGNCCQIFISQTGDYLETICYWGAGTGEPNTGQNCTNGTQCCTGTCFDYPGFCLGVCINDGDCPTVSEDPCSTDDDCDLGYLCSGTTCTRRFTCKTQPFYLGADMFGQPIMDTANICLPDRRTCALPSDCRDIEACKLYYNETATAVSFQCEAGGPGTGRLGDNCWPNGAAACWNNLCLLEEGGGEGKQYCTQVCVEDADCGDPLVYYCSSIRFDVRPGFVSYLPVCQKRNIK